MALTFQDGTLSFHRLPEYIHHSEIRITFSKTDFRLPIKTGAFSPFFFIPGSSTSRVYLIDGEKTLFRMDFPHGASSGNDLTRIDGNVIAGHAGE